MPVYKYEAVSPTGDVIKSQGQFDTLQELYRFLKEQNLYLVRYKSTPVFITNLLSPKIMRQDLIEFFHNASLMLKGGVPLLEALDEFRLQCEKFKLRQVFFKMVNDVQQGMFLSQSMRDMPHIFSKLVCTIIDIGERSGNLDLTMEHAAQHIQHIDDIISATKRAMMYPMFVLVAMGGSMAFWMFYVLPKILGVFKTMNIKLPVITKGLIVATDLSQKYWWSLPFFVIALIAIITSMKLNPKTRLVQDKIILKIPIVGLIVRNSQLAFFYEYLALLIKSGVPVVDALQLMEDSMTNLVYRNAVEKIKQLVAGGVSMKEAFYRTKIFSPFDLRMIGVGEHSGTLDSQFVELSAYYRKIVLNLVENISKLVEPILITIAGLLFMVIALGLIGPIYNLISAVK